MFILHTYLFSLFMGGRGRGLGVGGGGCKLLQRNSDSKSFAKQTFIHKLFKSFT